MGLWGNTEGTLGVRGGARDWTRSGTGKDKIIVGNTGEARRDPKKGEGC